MFAKSTIAILGALEKEVRYIAQAIKGAAVESLGGLTVFSGTYQGFYVVTTVAGMGTVNAAAAAQLLISTYGADALIFTGIAGGLNPALHSNDIVIGKRLRYTDTDTALIAESAPGLEEFASTDYLVDLAEEVLLANGYVDAGLSAEQAGSISPGQAADASPSRSANHASEPKHYLKGTIATGNRFITGADARAALIQATQADCAEMEGAAIAHIAAKNGIDCLVLRAISDNCDEAYDALSARSFDLNSYARTASEIVLAMIRRLHVPLGMNTFPK
ncbi:5'-methylthioadenosine/S-adenosylhomocysteine nucleosidase [Collinsella sp. AGMB00827]|uniref:5'-methylthioadenosine/S-adenosylhomocysteine nucleosidase n=1 Tax=Collinsella ureilytica TaxID=2869515 RepID=A0ABS7MHU3_9ACTN|nr:5'-methylthioadenosine/S-adenosylhomocysteine nucleosidase [Collinsella urealyticum]MBY4796920.1 5'-methylthioadenosine/S-adenosylhomocysteine nucleosidase [Collinsella urealyticum]